MADNNKIPEFSRDGWVWDSDTSHLTITVGSKDIVVGFVTRYLGTYEAFVGTGSTDCRNVGKSSRLTKACESVETGVLSLLKKHLRD